MASQLIGNKSTSLQLPQNQQMKERGKKETDGLKESSLALFSFFNIYLFWLQQVLVVASPLRHAGSLVTA